MATAIHCGIEKWIGGVKKYRHHFCGMQAMTASGGSHVADTGNPKPKQERDKSSMTIVISISKRESGLMIYI
jgi:hypothetical protein